MTGPRYTVGADALPHVARVTCGPHCLTCAGRGEWVVVVPTAMVDLDSRIRSPAAYVAAARQLHADGPAVLGYKPSRRGGLHVYLDAPVEQCGELADMWGGDALFARFSVERGWCGERPGGLPVAVEATRRRPEWWAELLRSHGYAAALVRGELL